MHTVSQVNCLYHWGWKFLPLEANREMICLLVGWYALSPLAQHIAVQLLTDISASASDSSPSVSGREHDGTLVVVEDDDCLPLAEMSSSLGEGTSLSVSEDFRPFFRPHHSTRLACLFVAIISQHTRGDFSRWGLDAHCAQLHC